MASCCTTRLPRCLQKWLTRLNSSADDATIGGNGALWQVLFDPERLLFWLAAGEVPVPSNPFLCSLGEMIGLPGAARCEARAIE